MFSCLSNANKWRLKLHSSWTRNGLIRVLIGQRCSWEETECSRRYNHAAKLVRRREREKKKRSGCDLRFWLSIEPLFPAHSVPRSPSAMMSSVGRYFSQTQPVCSCQGATVTLAALKVWEWAPVTCRQGRYLFFLERIQYLLLLLRGSELQPELWGTKQRPSRDTPEVVSSVTVPRRTGEC